MSRSIEFGKYVKPEYNLFIGGKWIPAESGTTIEVKNPANGTHLSICADAGLNDVNEAVKSAQDAFAEWKKVSPIERASILHRIADIMEENQEHLAVVEALDNGKAIRETRAMDVPLSIDHFRYFASAIRTEEGSATMLDDTTMSIIMQEPLGVVGQIVPWNFPLLMASWKIAPALAAGNTIVFKPSSETSLSVLEVAKLIEKILPPGVLNIVTGGGSTAGNHIIRHPDIRKLAFTGSTEIGYEVADAAARKLIPATLELGGKSANIFFSDLNMERALEGGALGVLWNQGQVCCAGSRLFVQDEIYDEFVEKLATIFDSAKVGLPWEDDTVIGSLINDVQVQKVLNYIEIGKQEGAKLVTGGYKITDPELEKGNYIKPALFSEVTNDMRIAREEIFGPVAVLIRFKDEDEVIKYANDNDYGLGGAVWTADINRAIRVARAVETGRMWINTYGSTPAHIPFGGYKKSGLGRETHIKMLEHYSNTKSIMIQLKETKDGLY